MKHLILTLVLALLSAIGTQAQTTQIKFYEACKGQDGFETTYIGKTMLQMVKGRGMKVKGMDLNTVIDKIDAIMVINTDSEGEKLKKLTADISTSKGYELLVDRTENEESLTILYRRTGKKTNEYVLKINGDNGDEMTVIIITGSLTPEDIIKLKHH